MQDKLTEILLTQEEIRSKIYTVRGIQVIIDTDLAKLYAVDTRILNRAVQRNIKRFPLDFMFEITLDEFTNLKCQNGTSSWGGKRKPPKVFTEIGIATLSGILQSDTAIQANIQIMRAFVEMRRFLLINARVFQKVDNVEKDLLEYKLGTNKKFEKVFEALEYNEIKPKQGVFFDGQVFDAYKFVSDIIREAQESIIIVDNYIDDTVLDMLTKRKEDVRATIFTKNISRQLNLDIAKYNSQYPEIKIKEFKESHDRFIIIDDKEVYHIGASLKDLGKKWFGFSKFDKESLKIIERLQSAGI